MKQALPLYEYRCTSCSHRFDKIQKFNSEPETACPRCGGQLERPLTAPALQFKGAGWYVNDYASKPTSSSDKPASEAAPATGESKPAESKSAESRPAAESKPAAASDSSSKPASTSGSS